MGAAGSTRLPQGGFTVFLLWERSQCTRVGRRSTSRCVCHRCLILALLIAIANVHLCYHTVAIGLQVAASSGVASSMPLVRIFGHPRLLVRVWSGMPPLAIPQLAKRQW